MKHVRYPTGIRGVVVDPELQDLAVIELRRFLGLPIPRNDVRKLIMIDELTVGVTLVNRNR